MLIYYIRCETVKKSLLVTPDLQKNQQSRGSKTQYVKTYLARM